MPHRISGQKVPLGTRLAVLLSLLLTPTILAQSRAEVSTFLNHSALKAGSDAAIAIVLNVQAGFHAQSHTPLDENLIPCEVELDDNASVVASAPIYPPGEVQTYAELGKVSVYTGKNIIYLPIKVKSDASPGPVKLTGKLHFQICDDKQCFMPEKQTFAIETRIVPASQTVEPVNAQLFSSMPAAPPSPPAAAVSAANPEQTKSFASILLLAFCAGLLFNIMPCVLPVLPLKAIGFYEVSQHNRARSFLFGLVFSLGVIAVFAVLALLVIVLKAFDWGGLFSRGWFVWSIVVLLVFLSAGLFGGWNLKLPMGVYTLEARHDTFGGNFFWGAFSAILATPCTAPLLPVVLAWAATQPKSLGVPAMLMVGVGMASPYLILSATPEIARRFPRSGPWPDLFKQMMGFLLLASAAYFGGGRLVHGLGFWWIVTAVVAVASVYLMARSVQLTKNALPVAICAILAVTMLGGTLAWTTRITGILSSAGGGNVESAWVPYSDDQFKAARESGNIVLVKFTANWCGTCQYIEGTVFRDPAVWDYLKKNGVIALKADFTDANPQADALLRTLNPGGGIPLTAIYAPGAEKPIQLASVYDSDTLLNALKQLPHKAVAVAR